MIGKGGQGGQEGRGGRDIGRSYRGQSYSGATPNNKGLCRFLDNRIFDYRQKASEDQIITKREKLVHHVKKKCT